MWVYDFLCLTSYGVTFPFLFNLYKMLTLHMRSGIAHCQILSAAYTAVYYNMIIAYAIYYFGASFSGITGNLPWRYCNNTWNDECRCNRRFVQLSRLIRSGCFDDKIAKTCNATLKEVYYMGQCYDAARAKGPSANASFTVEQFNKKLKAAPKTPAQQY